MANQLKKNGKVKWADFKDYPTIYGTTYKAIRLEDREICVEEYEKGYVISLCTTYDTKKKFKGAGEVVGEVLVKSKNWVSRFINENYLDKIGIMDIKGLRAGDRKLRNLDAGMEISAFKSERESV